MGQERRNYRQDRILIEASRILNPQFDAIQLELTGAQVELLRNATMLFHAQSTFVDEYHNGYYLDANDADYDDIRAIVADLEERLMGSMNTQFGYKDVYQEEQQDTDVSTPTVILEFAEVPEGEVWVVTQWTAINEDTRTTINSLRIEMDTGFFYCAAVHPDVANHLVGTTTEVVIKEGQHMEVVFNGCAQSDVVRAWVAGYKMDVPT